MEIVEKEKAKNRSFNKLNKGESFIAKEYEGYLYTKINSNKSDNTLGFDVKTNENFICEFRENHEVIPVEILRVEYQRK